MSKLLMDDPPIVVSPKLAALIGLEGAVFLQQVHYWVFKNQGRASYNTTQQWQAQLPFMSVRSLERLIKSLKERGLLIVTQKRNSFDKTNFYAINHQALEQLTSPVDAGVDTANLAESDRHNGGTETDKLTGSEPAKLAVSDTENQTTSETTTDTLSHSSDDTPKTDQAVQSPAQPATVKTTTKGTRISPDWVLTKALGDWAKECCPHWTDERVRDESYNFKDYWLQVAGARAIKVDWDATWRTWMRKAKQIDDERKRTPRGAGTNFAEQRQMNNDAALDFFFQDLDVKGDLQ